MGAWADFPTDKISRPGFLYTTFRKVLKLDILAHDFIETMPDWVEDNAINMRILERDVELGAGRKSEGDLHQESQEFLSTHLAFYQTSGVVATVLLGISVPLLLARVAPSDDAVEFFGRRFCQVLICAYRLGMAYVVSLSAYCVVQSFMGYSGMVSRSPAVPPVTCRRTRQGSRGGLGIVGRPGILHQ
jgi:hypothetical protein